MPRKHEHSKRQVSKTEQILDILLSGKDISPEDLAMIHYWLGDMYKECEKSEALAKKLSEAFRLSKNPQYTPDMWPELAARLGIDPDIINNTRRVGMGVRMPLRRRVVMRAVAVLIPFFVAVVTLVLLVFDKAGDTTRVADIVMVPASGEQIMDIPTADIVTISVPSGQTVEITLADSSRVTLGSDSELIYDNNFTDGRSVKLSGEAKFDIKKATDEQGATQPFTVSTNNLKVDVTGTVFRITDCKDSTHSAVALYRGSVRVKSGSTHTNLLPGDIFRCNHATHESDVSIISAKEMLDNGMLPVLRFDRSSLSNLILAMESNHNVKFVVPADIDLASDAISADFRDVPLSDAVKLLSITDRLHSYELSGNKIIITKKPDTYDD